jgi:hypothetical protein
MTRWQIRLAVAWAGFIILWFVAPFPGWEIHAADFRSGHALASWWAYAPHFGRNLLLDWIFIYSHSTYLILLSAWAWVLLALPAFLIGFPLAVAVDRVRSGRSRQPKAGKLPPYPEISQRHDLSFVIGEKHIERQMVPARNPTWLSIPERGLYVGTLVMGATGSGKTSCIMLPAAEQLFGYRAHDPLTRCGGLVLEAKGNFCSQVRDVLIALGRESDYIEIGPESRWCYNPLYNDTDATELAFDVMSVVRSLGGDTKNEGKFWDEAAESFISFVIQAKRLLEGYVTLRDVYVAAMDPSVISDMMETAEAKLNPTWVLIDKAWWADPANDDAISRLRKGPDNRAIKWESAEPHHFRTKATADLMSFIGEEKIPHAIESETGSAESKWQMEELASVRLSYKAMRKHNQDTFANVRYGLQVVLDIVDKNRDVKRVFCPPKEAYDADLNSDFKYGRPLPKLEELIETSNVICLRVPVRANPKMARIMGTLLKQNWQRAVIGRIEKISSASRPLVLLADEYHLLANTGGSRPIGDDKFLQLSREAKCVPVVAIPSISALSESLPRDAWRGLFSCFRSTICLSGSDVFSAEHVSKMAGRELQWRQSISLGEGNQDPRVSPISGGVVSEKRSVSLSHSRSTHLDPIYEINTIRELPWRVGIAMIHDGTRQLPPTYVYTRPFGCDEGYKFD